MREDRLVADFLLSIIDRFTEGILVVCVNSFYIGKRYTDVVGGDYMAYCYEGKTYETIKELAEEYGIDRKRIYSFRHRGGGHWKKQYGCASMMCVGEEGFLNTMESCTDLPKH